MMRRHCHDQRAQAILEFTAGMIVLCLIIFGMIAVFRWGLMDLAERRYDHETLMSNSSLNMNQQLEPDFHTMRPMDAVVYSNSNLE